MVVHNHGSEEGAGLSCNELRLPNGQFRGACLVNEEKKIVPLIDRTGNEPKVIGTAEVEIKDGLIQVEANITDEEAKKIFRPKPGDFSIAPDTFRK